MFSTYPLVICESDLPTTIQTFESDCACPALPTPAPTHLNAVFPRHSLLQQTTAVKKDIDEKHTVLISPRQPSGVVVLDQRVVTIWEQFAEAIRPTDLPAMDHLSQPETHYVMERLWQSQFLREVNTPPPPIAKPDTLLVWLHVTNACNLRCTYCYLNKTEEALDASTGRAAVAAILRSALAHHYAKVKIKYAGGEALLNFRQLLELHDDALELFAQQGIELSAVVLSNGVGLRKDQLLALKIRQIGLMISLDGIGPTHDTHRKFANGKGSFIQVAHGIEKAVECGITPNLSITVTAENASSLAETVAWILDRHLPFSINFYRENDLTTEVDVLHQSENQIIRGMLAAFKVIEQNLPPYSVMASVVDRANVTTAHTQTCGVGEHYMVIDQHGKIAKCQMQIDQPVTTVFADDPLGLIRADQIGILNPTVDEIEGCRGCQWKYWCTGGCPLATYRATGRYDVKSPNCGIYQALFPELVRLEGLRYLKYAKLDQ